jgi:hypothetical protein
VSAHGRGLGNVAGERGNERRSTLIGSVIEIGGEINSPFKDRRCGCGWEGCWIVSEGEESPVELGRNTWEGGCRRRGLVAREEDRASALDSGQRRWRNRSGSSGDGPMYAGQREAKSRKRR